MGQSACEPPSYSAPPEGQFNDIGFCLTLCNYAAKTMSQDETKAAVINFHWPTMDRTAPLGVMMNKRQKKAYDRLRKKLKAIIEEGTPQAYQLTEKYLSLIYVACSAAPAVPLVSALKTERVVRLSRVGRGQPA